MIPCLLGLLIAAPPTPWIGPDCDPPGHAAGLADPYVLTRDGVDWVFGTGARGCRVNGSERAPFQLHLDYGSEAARGARQVWSFKVYGDDASGYHAYGSVHYGQFRTVIASFSPAPGEIWTDRQPIGHWRLERLLVGDFEQARWAYDASEVTDGDGTRYLVWTGRDPERGGPHLAICRQRLAASGELDSSDKPVVLLRPEGLRSEDRNPPGGMQLVEAANLRRIGEWWVMLYSVGDFDQANYKFAAAFRRDLDGPFTKTRAADGHQVAYLLQTEHADAPNFAGGWCNGPGAAALVPRPSPGVEGWDVVFHGRLAGRAGLHGAGRYVWRLPVSVSIDAARPMREWLRVMTP
jgi:hypothetical protein